LKESLEPVQLGIDVQDRNIDDAVCTAGLKILDQNVTTVFCTTAVAKDVVDSVIHFFEQLLVWLLGSL
jgi:hypothetical protein